MKKLLISLTIAVMASSCVAALALTATGAGAARGQGSGTTLPPPFATANRHSLFITVDTVQGSGGIPKPAAGCSMTNLFVQGQQVVFRMWGIDVRTGGNALTDKNVLRAYITIPGLSAPIPLSYGAHGTTSFWAAPWSTKGYPMGIVDFTVTVMTKPVPKTAKHARIPGLKVVYSQIGLAPPSRLTIT